MKRREFITLLGGAASLFFCVNAAAQEPLPPVRTRRETKKARACRGFQGVDHLRGIQGSRCPRRPDTTPRHKSGKARIA